MPPPDHRGPPGNPEAEQALLAAILASNDTYDIVAAKLQPGHFSDAVHGRIYEVCAETIEAGNPADAVTLAHIFDEAEELDLMGGNRYLAELQASVVSLQPGDVSHYAAIIHECWQRRRMIDVGHSLIEDARIWNGVRAPGYIARADETLLEVANGHEGGSAASLEAAVTEALETTEHAMRRRSEGRCSGLTTGIMALDDVLGGLHPGHLAILAGRPGMGKTALALGLAHAAAVLGVPVDFYSREQRASELSLRLLAMRTRTVFDRIHKGEIGAAEFHKLEAERPTLNALPLRIEDKHCRTVSAMRAHSRPRKRSEGLGLIVVDYIQLVHTVGKHQNRDQEVGAVSRALKDLAKDLDVPVLALCQLNRGAEHREDRKPQLSDLRESGSLEQDADEVIGLYREHYYLERQRMVQRPDEDMYDFEARRQKHLERCNKIRFQAEALVLKNRFGPTANVMIGADLACMRFMDVEES